MGYRNEKPIHQPTVQGESMKNLFKVLALAISMVFLTACSSGPSESDISSPLKRLWRICNDGRTQRFKTVEESLKEPEDVLVFVPPWERVKDRIREIYPTIFSAVTTEEEYIHILLKYVHLEGRTVRVIDGFQEEILTNKEASHAYQEGLQGKGNLFLAFIDKIDSTKSFTLPVSAIPKIDYLTFDTSKYEENGRTMRSRHLGNKVVEIKYKDS